MPDTRTNGSVAADISRNLSTLRRAGSQAYLLARYEELGTFREACWNLVHLHDGEPGRYRQVTGSDRLPQYETLCRYWKGIPVAQRRAAKQRYLRRS